MSKTKEELKLFYEQNRQLFHREEVDGIIGPEAYMNVIQDVIHERFYNRTLNTLNTWSITDLGAFQEFLIDEIERMKEIPLIEQPKASKKAKKELN